MKRIPIAIAAALLLSSAGVVQAAPAGAGHFTGQELAPLARVSLAEARAIALKARPGQITDQELEKEAGGTGLRYSFDIKSQGRTFEVGVDARSGRVLEHGPEGANPD